MTIELNEDELNSVNGGLPRIPTKGMGVGEPQKPTPIPFNENPKIGLYFGPVNRNRG